MKKIILACAALLASAPIITAQGFQNPALQWNIPANMDIYDYTTSHTLHTVMDMNGDGKPDLIDSENQATENVADVFYNGNQKYWRVYLSNGTSFNAAPIQWNIPANLDIYDYQVSHTLHTVIDMNGDGLPDLVDSSDDAVSGAAVPFVNGNQKYWKVYLNTGSGFSATAIQWNIPPNMDIYDYTISHTLHAVVDMNGDGKPDLVDSENEAINGPAEPFMNGNQKYWKVYLNTGSGFAATAIQWNIPPNMDNNDYQVFYTIHTVMDFNGDGKPDLIDSSNEAINGPAEPFMNGNQKYWKVYLNTGNGFAATGTQWNIPPNLDGYDYYVSYNTHVVVDFNGDGKPDLIDSYDTNAEPFYNGNQKYWKVYMSTGSGFSATATQWNIPASLDTYNYYVYHTLHTVMDFNGDGKPDLIDSENEAANGAAVPFNNGSQKYWKVYLNNAPSLSATAFDSHASALRIYPNPAETVLNLAHDQRIEKVTILNLMGQQVFAQTVEANEGQIDVSALTPGTYLARVQAGGAIQTVKIIKK